MHPFKFYVESSLVKKCSPDPGEAKAMMSRSIKRLEYITAQKIDENNASFLFEDIYEAMRESIHGIMVKRGYNPYSHEATVAFLEEFYRNFFGEKLVADFNRYRIMRNNIMYRASYVNEEETKKALISAEKFVEKADSVLKSGL